MKLNDTLSLDRLKEILDYNPLTGIFIWKISTSNRIKVGQIAGSLRQNGYYYIGINGKSYKSCRLAWVYVKGYWPKLQIDHCDKIKTNDKIDNLREASSLNQGANQYKRPNNISGYKGVTWHKNSKKWKAQIKRNRINKHLGLFVTKEEAYEAYCFAAKAFDGDFFQG